MPEQEASLRVARRVIDELGESDERVAVVEGVTGGAVAALLSAPSGASEVFDRAYVPYAYDALRDQVGVEREPLDRHGAVSDPVARSLARRGRDLADTTWGLSTVGIAGPGGGTDATPVGTVHGGIAYAAPWDTDRSFVEVDERVFDGDREAVRSQASVWLLERLLDTRATLAERSDQ